VKTSPEKLERERERLRLYQQKKSAMPEELERKKLHAREYRKKKELLTQNKLNIDSEASTRASDSERGENIVIAKRITLESSKFRVRYI